ncbi:hypothetical protein D3C72_2054630 [compost metagenome]
MSRVDAIGASLAASAIRGVVAGGGTSSIQAFSKVEVTARITGPMNRPTMPKANMPPSTPDKISSSDRLTPRLISMGRSRLSSVATTSAQTSSTMAASFMSF